jgi:hypothetical protein
MMIKLRSIPVILLVLALMATLSQSILAQPLLPGGYDREDFKKIAGHGFSDPMNNYSWSMGYFKDHVYVGVGRNSTFGVINGMGLPSEITDILYEEITVPSGTPGSLEFANDMRGEIWRSSSLGGSWERVYQASVFQPPAQPGVFLASEIGFRGPMATFTDKWGEEAIYTFRAGALPPNNVILKSTDGNTWERVRTPSIVCDSPSAPYMGNPRAMTVHNGKLYVGGGEARANGGGPFVWATDDPVAATDLCTPAHNWTLVADFSGEGPGTSTAVGSLKSFNGYLYVGLDNRETGFQVWRSNAQSPDEPGLGGWTKVVDYGAGDMHNWRAACMDVLDNRLYVGSLSLPGAGDEPGFMLPKGFEIIRIDNSDAWELVVGDYLPLVPAPGVTVPRVPISGWPGGFGNFLNFYCWSMQVSHGVLYIGSFDASFFLRFLPIEALMEIDLTLEQIEQVVAALEQLIAFLEELEMDEYYIEPFELLLDEFDVEDPGGIDWEVVAHIIMGRFSGGDIWKTQDGVIWQPVTLNGFGNPDNYGFRNMVHANPLFAGTTNPVTGLEVWKAPPPSVGGEVYAVDMVDHGKGMRAIGLWVGLASIVAIGGGICVLRRRRAH